MHSLLAGVRDTINRQGDLTMYKPLHIGDRVFRFCCDPFPDRIIPDNYKGTVIKIDNHYPNVVYYLVSLDDGSERWETSYHIAHL